MKLLSLDYSSTCCGFCYFDTETKDLILSSIAPSGDEPERIRYIPEILADLPLPSNTIVEEVTSMTNANTLRTLLRGAGYTIGKLGISYDTVSYVRPGEWRKSAWGRSPRKRAEAKQLAMDKLWDWGIPYSNDDEAEALGLMLWYVKHNCKEHLDYLLEPTNYKFEIEDVYETQIN